MKFMYKQLLTVAALLSINNAVNAAYGNASYEFNFSNVTENNLLVRISSVNNRDRYEIIKSQQTINIQNLGVATCLSGIAWALYNPAMDQSNLVDKSTLSISETNQMAFGRTVAPRFTFTPLEMKTMMPLCRSSNFTIYNSGKLNNVTHQPVLAISNESYTETQID
jgi:hypothetical protein